MLKKLFFILSVFTVVNVNAQKVFSKTGTIYFDANSPIEKIDGTSNKGTGVIDIASGKIEVKMLIKSFKFQKALMEEHFNENYMESLKYPDAVFVGEIADIKNVNLTQNGTYKVNVKGKLTMHGVTKDVTAPGSITVKGGTIAEAKSNFKILIADYGITIPSAVKDKIAKEAKIDVSFNMQPLK
jgi:polyisoprenoid-binding protein YceI